MSRKKFGPGAQDKWVTKFMPLFRQFSKSWALNIWSYISLGSTRKHNLWQRLLGYDAIRGFNPGEQERKAEWGGESQYEDALSSWLLLIAWSWFCGTAPPPRKPSKLHNHVVRLEEKGERLSASSHGSVFSLLYLNSSLLVAFGWVHGRLLRHPVPIQQQGIPRAGGEVGQEEPIVMSVGAHAEWVAAVAFGTRRVWRGLKWHIGGSLSRSESDRGTLHAVRFTRTFPYATERMSVEFWSVFLAS